MKVDRRVRSYRYPPHRRFHHAVAEMIGYPRIWFSSRSFWLFHVSMTAVIVTWLLMDLPFFLLGMDESILMVGGLVYPVRVVHRFVGGLFVIAFLVYAWNLATNRLLRQGLSRFDYIEFAMMAAVVAYGVSYTVESTLGDNLLLLPWTIVEVYLPWSPKPFVVGLHIFIVYAWFALSLAFRGSIAKALSSMAVTIRRGVAPPPTVSIVGQGGEAAATGNLTRYGLLQLTSCGREGECIAACPAHDELSEEGSSPRSRLLKYRSLAYVSRGPFAWIVKRQPSEERIKALRDELYECTLCGRCSAICPVELDLVELWKAAREGVCMSGAAPEIVESLASKVGEDKNLYGMPNESRMDWVAFEEADVPIKDKARMVYFPGCLTSYSSRLGAVGKAVSALLNHLGEDWTILGMKEWCCGAPLSLGGLTARLQELARHNVEAVEQLGAERVVFNCPGCYRVFQEVYPRVLGRKPRFESVHVVEYLAEKVKGGKLAKARKLEAPVTYHDPCELARFSGLYAEPRVILTRLAESFIELTENELATRCCGGGGLLKGVKPELSQKVAATRVSQVLQTQAQLLVSACPSCLLTLSEAVSNKGLSIRVLDIAELVAEQALGETGN